MLGIVCIVIFFGSPWLYEQATKGLDIRQSFPYVLICYGIMALAAWGFDFAARHP